MAMDQGTKSILNVLVSVLAPVLVLEKCSADGSAWYQIGVTGAMVIALALPIACGLLSFISSRQVNAITILGLAGALCTGLVTCYARTGEGMAIRPDTPWWYAAKEALIPVLMAAAVLITAKSRSSLLRTFIYSDALFDISSIESAVQEHQAEKGYSDLMKRSNHILAGSLLLSAGANFLLALYFLLPVLERPAEEQALHYNYAVGNMTWWGYLIVGIPLLLTVLALFFHLLRTLSSLTGFDRDRLLLR